MAGVFLSHSSRDKPTVRRIAASLAASGISVWVDEAEMNVGDSLISKISAAIAQTDFVAVVISSSSISSNWVTKELEWAMTKEIEGRKVVVLPVLIDDCAIPFFLRDKLYADLRSSADFDQGIAKLCFAVHAHFGHGGRPVAGSPDAAVDDAGKASSDATPRAPSPHTQVGEVLYSYRNEAWPIRALGKNEFYGESFIFLGVVIMALGFLIASPWARPALAYSIVFCGGFTALAGSLVIADVHYTTQAYEMDPNLLRGIDDLRGGWPYPFSPKWWKFWEKGATNPTYRTAMKLETGAVILLNLAVGCAVVAASLTVQLIW